MAILNVNTDKVVDFSNKLEKLHKSAFPSAIRNTLNQVAFNVKGAKTVSGKPTLQRTTEGSFTKRNKGFFKVASSVKTAQGFDIQKMESVVGFTDKRMKAYSQPVQNLKQQEHGGTIGGRSFIPMKSARVGGSWQKKVRKKEQLTAINRVIDARDAKGQNDAERFTRAAIQSGKGGYVLGTEDAEGNRYMMKVNSIKRKGPDNVINSTPLYVYKQGRRFSVPSTKFMARASKLAARRMEDIYIDNAKFQINKFK